VAGAGAPSPSDAACGREAAPSPKRLIDVGSGAGLPGIPLAILLAGAGAPSPLRPPAGAPPPTSPPAGGPRIRVTLLESIGKKARFLEEAARALVDAGLPGGALEVRCARAEDAARDPGLRARFDFATARAVAALPALLELALPFLRPGGLLVAMKGRAGQAAAEAAASERALKELGGALVGVDAFELPQGLGERTLVLVRKAAPTPARYPRAAAAIKKSPL
jgi:16S rRNA (guanine527-N7)-methyltransferase